MAPDKIAQVTEIAARLRHAAEFGKYVGHREVISTWGQEGIEIMEVLYYAGVLRCSTYGEMRYQWKK